MLKKFSYFFYTVSRGYSLPTSFSAWAVAFIYCFCDGGNAIYGLIALVGIILAHLGTNLLDDCIDTIFKVPKQKCKTEYLDNGEFSLKTVAIVCAVYFLIAILTGIFLFFKAGWPVASIAGSAGVIMLAYPRLNHYALGEIAVAMTYGLLLFAGIGFVMSKTVDFHLILLSIPVSLLIMNLLFAHSLMDFNFDKENGKKTLCVRLGSQQRALWAFVLIVFSASCSNLLLIVENILPADSILALIVSLLFNFRAFCKLKIYISQKNHDKNEFMDIFKLVRNASMAYNLLVALIIWQK